MGQTKSNTIKNDQIRRTYHPLQTKHGTILKRLTNNKAIKHMKTSAGHDRYTGKATIIKSTKNSQRVEGS